MGKYASWSLNPAHLCQGIVATIVFWACVLGRGGVRRTEEPQVSSLGTCSVMTIMS